MQIFWGKYFMQKRRLHFLKRNKIKRGQLRLLIDQISLSKIEVKVTQKVEY